MASSRDSVALAIWRKLGEPENAQKIIDMGGVALVALIRWTVIFLVLYPLANAGAKWVDGITDQQGVITEQFRTGSWHPAYAVPKADPGP